ncbi:MAG TPA: GDSL-type esterase/lipase family protein [Allosphingosinicella sp.]|nr:GDSL-type esterase/lipase family protein [Allosphingosinicella sp.]
MAAFLAALAALAALHPEPGACATNLCNAEALRPFLEALRPAPEGTPRRLHILQIGDSHTAGDMMTEAWRRRLQARFGHGGRGVLAGGRPYPGYLTWAVTAAQSDGWNVNALFGAAYRAEGAPLGLSGFTQTARHRGESLALAGDNVLEWFDRLTICAVAGRQGGAVRLRVGSAHLDWRLTAAECRTLDSVVPATSASLVTADDRPVAVTSFAVFRRQGGALLSNVGVPGAQLTHFGRTDERVLAAELGAYRPDLMVLAFGTNEGFSPVLTADVAEVELRAQVARLRRLAGDAVPILLLGAPDAARAGGGGTACGDGWSVPDLLGAVRERQERVARELGLGFWDWAAAMGGRCASSAWHRAGLMRGDHVHFTRAGGERIGAMIDADIMRAVEALH